MESVCLKRNQWIGHFLWICQIFWVEFPNFFVCFDFMMLLLMELQWSLSMFISAIYVEGLTENITFVVCCLLTYMYVCVLDGIICVFGNKQNIFLWIVKLVHIWELIFVPLDISFLYMKSFYSVDLVYTALCSVNYLLLLLPTPDENLNIKMNKNSTSVSLFTAAFLKAMMNILKNWMWLECSVFIYLLYWYFFLCLCNIHFAKSFESYMIKHRYTKYS